ncbi:MAG: hypothetical protein AB2L26_11935 [Ignavibacteria bacterium]
MFSSIRSIPIIFADFCIDLFFGFFSFSNSKLFRSTMLVIEYLVTLNPERMSAYSYSSFAFLWYMYGEFLIRHFLNF